MSTTSTLAIALDSERNLIDHPLGYDVATRILAQVCGTAAAEDLPFRRFEQSGSELGEGRLPGAVRAQQRDDLTASQLQIRHPHQAVAVGMRGAPKLAEKLSAAGAVDEAYVAARTSGFGDVRRGATVWWPERVERVSGVPVSELRALADLLAGAERVMVLTARGAEQHAQGTATVLGWINVALALGMCGRPYAGYGCLTGQGNGQGGRELRLSYCFPEPDRIREGVRRLAGVVEQELELLETFGPTIVRHPEGRTLSETPSPDLA